MQQKLLRTGGQPDGVKLDRSIPWLEILDSDFGKMLGYTQNKLTMRCMLSEWLEVASISDSIEVVYIQTFVYVQVLVKNTREFKGHAAELVRKLLCGGGNISISRNFGRPCLTRYSYLLYWRERE